MTREEWKEKLPFIQAFVNGEDVRCFGKSLERPDFKLPITAYSIVKPTQYVPFENGDEFIEALSKQKVHLLKHKCGEWCSISGVWKGYVRTSLDPVHSFYELLRSYKFADGTPCGKLAE